MGEAHKDVSEPVGAGPAMMLNAVLSRAALMAKAMDGANRNLNDECGYPDTISVANYTDYYNREGVAKRVAHCLPDESWTSMPHIYETEDVEETLFELAWDDLDRRLHLLHYLYRADKLSGIGRFGIVLLGLDDGKPLEQPVEGIGNDGLPEDGWRGMRQYDLLYLRVFSENVVTIRSKEKDTTNPRYGQPVSYTVALEDVTLEGSVSSKDKKTVHWTRVLHVADNREESEVFGVPRMQPVFNRLFDLRKILGASAEMFWKGAFPGISFEMPAELAQAGVSIDQESLAEQVADYYNGLQRYIATQGLTAKNLAPQVVSPTEHLEAQLKSIAISLGIPNRILFGSEQAELASTQDTRTWNKRLARRREEYISPMLIRPFIDRLLLLGVLPDPEDFYVEWPDLDAPSEGERADTAGKIVKALGDYVKGEVDMLVPPEEFFSQIMGFSPDQIGAIMEAAATYVEKQDEDEDTIPEPVIPAAPQDVEGIEDPAPPPSPVPPDGT